MYLKSPNISASNSMPGLFQSLPIYVLLQKFIYCLCDSKSLIYHLKLALVLELQLCHSDHDFKEFIAAKLFVGVVFQVSSVSADFFEVDGEEQPVDIRDGQVSPVNDLPAAADVGEINHGD